MLRSLFCYHSCHHLGWKFSQPIADDDASELFDHPTLTEEAFYNAVHEGMANCQPKFKALYEEFELYFTPFTLEFSLLGLTILINARFLVCGLYFYVWLNYEPFAT